MDNMQLWGQVEKTNPQHTKEVKFGRRFTAIDAHYQIQRATEMFGPCGQGWGIRNSQYQILTIDPTDAHYSLLQFTAQLWYIMDGKEGAFDIAADIELFEWSEKNQKWLRVEDSHKKVRTDAVTKGLSWLGFNADVFMGRFDDNKYVAQVKREFEAEEKAKVQQIGPSKSVELPALDELATAKKQLWSAAKARKMGQTELAVFAESQIGVKPESLNLEQARQLVTLLGGVA